MIERDDKYKGLLDAEGKESFSDAINNYIFDGDTTVFQKAFTLEFNSDHAKRKDKSDFFSHFMPAIIVSSRMLELIKEIAPDAYKEVKISSPNPDHYGLIIVSEFSSVLDRERSKFDEYPNGLLIYKLSCLKDKMPSAHIFRIEHYSSILVSEEFREEVIKRKLKGVDFLEVPCN